MYLIKSLSYDPNFNLATEEYFLKQTNKEIIMLWVNSPCVVIGKNQNPYYEIDMSYAKKHNIPIIRRITGGGAVYHDKNNVNFTFIKNCAQQSNIDFSDFTLPIISLLNQKKINAYTHRNDILVNGSKISGNAQLIYKNRVLHHGTLLFETNLDVLSKVLIANPIKQQKKFTASTPKPTTNINHFLSDTLSTDQWIDEILSYFKKHLNTTEYCLTQNDIQEIQKLKKRKYDQSEWTFSKDLTYSYLKQDYFQCGLVQLHFSVLEEKIICLKITGDFFSSDCIEDLENLIIGTPYSYKLLESKILKIEIQKYIHNIQHREFIDLFFSN